MRADQAKTIAIVDYLSLVEGIEPTHNRMRGKELWYHSPIRSGDSSPSFKVDTDLNLWHDHGLGIGGNVLDLVCKVRKVSIKEALAVLDRSGLYRGGYYKATRLVSNSGYAVAKRPNSAKTLFNETKKDESSSQLLIQEVKPLTSPALLDYLHSRHIDLDIAKQYLKEVRYKPADKLAEFFAIGWQNGKGYEARSKYFKGFIGTGKTISVINPKPQNDVVVFEGFMDFLSYLSYLKQIKGISELNLSAIVLNSTSLKKQLIQAVLEHDFRRIYLFLDNDDAGNEVKEFYKIALEDREIVDKSGIYSESKDFNEYWVSFNSSLS